jgi:5-deoxy-glucuronate isomerase
VTGTGTRWFLPLGSTARDGAEVAVDDTLDGWEHTALWVLDLAAGRTWQRPAAPHWEFVVVPLAGGVTVRATEGDGTEHTAELEGRRSVFTGPTDVAYVPSGSSLTLTGTDTVTGSGSRVAVCAAKVAGSPGHATFRHVRRDEVPVEMRGAGACSREVRNFAVPAVLDAESMIACEVLTPAGNWSSYPPHKHDEDRDGVETQLEEIYYFESRVTDGRAAGGEDPVGYQRVYGTPERPIEVLAEVRTGDVVLVPHGWHGPSMAAPGYDLYYLNVMAGPGATRAWLICDDPAHGWVRDTWESMAVDPRLPFGSGGDAMSEVPVARGEGSDG